MGRSRSTKTDGRLIRREKNAQVSRAGTVNTQSGEIQLLGALRPFSIIFDAVDRRFAAVAVFIDAGQLALSAEAV